MHHYHPQALERGQGLRDGAVVARLGRAGWA